MFTFRLQRVLDVREQREQELAAALALAQTAHDVAMARLHELEARRDAERLTMAHAASGASVAGLLRNAGFVLECLETCVTEARRHADEVSHRLAAAQSAFASAFQDRRVLDRLKERRGEEHRVEATRQEQQTMDDIATSRHVRATTGRR